MSSLRTYVGAKIHGITVTDKSVDYHGSVSIDGTLLERAGIEPYEQVHIINLSTGARWVTYALPGPTGAFTLNGGGARLGEVGDRCVVLTYRQEETYRGAVVLFCYEGNAATRVMTY